MFSSFYLRIQSKEEHIQLFHDDTLTMNGRVLAWDKDELLVQQRHWPVPLPAR